MEPRKPLALLVMLVASLVLAAAGVSAAERIGLFRLTPVGSVPVDPCDVGAPECHPRPGDPADTDEGPGSRERTDGCGSVGAIASGSMHQGCRWTPRGHGLLNAVRHLAEKEGLRAAKKASEPTRERNRREELDLRNEGGERGDPGELRRYDGDAPPHGPKHGRGRGKRR